MSSSPDPPLEPANQGISLDALAAAFAQVMGTPPRPPADSAAASPNATDLPSLPANGDSPTLPGEETAAAAGSSQESTEAVGEDVSADAATVDDAVCPISPQTILEAMLFVGNRDNRPLAPGRAAELMRGVQADEVPPLVDELNRKYAATGCPYEIVSEGIGYRLTLRQELNALRSRFYGRVREARLSQPAIDVLALVAYQQPITGDQVNELRGKPSNHILVHLVRRGLLRVERLDPKHRTPSYYTTERFLHLFNLASIDDLPRSEEPT
jgi:segregation and condensation protein B